MTVQNEYTLISGLDELTPIGATDVLAIARANHTATGRVSLINLFGGTDKLSNLRTISDPNKLFGTNGTAGGVYSAISIGASTGLSLSNGTLSGIDATSTGTKGVASFNANHFTVSSGAVSITNADGAGTIPIDHDRLSNFVANEHISHSGVSLLNGSYITGGGDLTASRTISVDGVTTKPTSSKVVATLADGYIDKSFFKETVYIQLFPASENITTGVRAYFFLPSSLNGKTVLMSGAGLGTYGGGTVTIVFENNAGGDLFSQTTSSIAGAETAQSTALTGGTGYRYQINVTGAGTSCKGLDFWIVVG